MIPITTQPSILCGKVMHKRLFPKINQFLYGVYYVMLPIKNIHNMPSNFLFGINRLRLMSFYDKDHGAKQRAETGENPLWQWAMAMLKSHQLDTQIDEIMLVTMPRLWGYVFNPISFWLCLDDKHQVRAVLCQVNNTFGETHHYLCARDDKQPIDDKMVLSSKKLFHVSPYMPRDGRYEFRFSSQRINQQQHLHFNIDYYHENGKKQLRTTLGGKINPLSKGRLWRAFLSHPLQSFAVIFLIHWQALRLLIKKIKFFKKPQQCKKTLTVANEHHHLK